VDSMPTSASQWIITRKYARQCAALFPIALPTATKRAAKADA